MFRAHLGPSVIVWLIQLGIGIGVTIVLLIVGVVLAIAVAIPTVALFAAELMGAAIVLLVVAALVLVPLFLVVLGALGTFTHSVWTLAYLRLGRIEQPEAA
jgi:hypothetical protein